VTAFVLAGRLGGGNAWSRPGPRKALLIADRVGEAAESGIEIGSQVLEHVSVIEVDDTRLSAVIVRSRVILQELLGQQVRGFCYPYGHVDARVVEGYGPSATTMHARWGPRPPSVVMPYRGPTFITVTPGGGWMPSGSSRD